MYPSAAGRAARAGFTRRSALVAAQHAVYADERITDRQVRLTLSVMLVLDGFL
jgi:hypothetical protein